MDSEIVVVPVTSSAPRDWKLVLTVSACSYEALRNAIESWQIQIAEIKSFEDLWTANMAFSGGQHWNYSTECTSPIQDRIKALREEADRLEGELKSPSSAHTPTTGAK